MGTNIKYNKDVYRLNIRLNRRQEKILKMYCLLTNKTISAVMKNYINSLENELKNIDLDGDKKDEEEK